MSLDKISVTLYDLLGFLLPGYVLLFALSIIEGTFLNSTVLSLSNYERHSVPFAAAAYFFGQISRSLASQFEIWSHAWFRKREPAPQPPAGEPEELVLQRRLIGLAKPLLGQMYQVPNWSTLENYQVIELADGYAMASGNSPARDVYELREGFFKTTMMAFGLCSLVLFSTLTEHGAHVRVQPQLLVHYGPGATALSAFTLLGLVLLFRPRRSYFRCLRENISLLLFLAYREKDLLAHPPTPSTQKASETAPP